MDSTDRKKIVFFSTNSNHFDGTKISTKVRPTCAEQLKMLADEHPDTAFSIVTQKPGTFLLDIDGNDIKSSDERIRCTIVPDSASSPEEFAQAVMAEKPDIAIAATFWVDPFDWLTVKDGLVAEILRRNGIRAIAHSSDTGIEMFDKFRTHMALKSLGMNVAEAVYVHHWLFVCAGTKGRVRENVYAEYVLEKIRSLRYPVVIKDTVGLSSYGMQVVGTFDEAKSFLLSRRNSSDRIVEELIPGEQFGTEIHGSDGKYKIYPPLMFSVNQYGITSPKQSVKAGPVTGGKYRIAELESSLMTMAQKLNLSGIAQVDLVFSDGKWFVIEVNPRISGMTTTYAVAEGKTIPELLLETENPDAKPMLKPVMNFKAPILSEDEMEQLLSLKQVKLVNQIENYAATQKREVGYAEIILSADDLMEALDEIREKFPHIVEENFYRSAAAITEKIRRDTAL